MRLRLPRYVHGFTDRHGKSRYYFRKPGFKRIPLPGPPYSPEFMAAHSAAMTRETAMTLHIGSSRTVAGTVNAAVIAYYNSDAFRALKPGTRQMRRAILQRFRDEHGDKRIATLPS